MYFKEGLKLIIKNKFSSIIIVIQLTIAFLTFILGVILINDTVSKLMNFNKVFNEKATICVKQQSTADIYNLDEESEKNLNGYYEKLSNDYNIAKFGISGFGKANYSELTDLDFISGGKEKGFTNIIYMDINFYKYFNNINLVKGRTFIEDDFKINEDDIIPIIISKDLEEYIKFGEIYLEKYKVIGVMTDNNNLYYNGNGTVYSGVTQKKNTIIEPINYKDLSNKKQIAFAIMQETIITLKDESLVEDYIYKLNKDLSNISEVPLEVNKIDVYKDEYINTIKGGIIATVSISFLLLTFSFFGIMGIILTSIIRRKKEFGIKLALGWTFKDICYQVISEIFLLSGVSFLFSNLGSIIFIYGDDNFRFNIYVYFIALIFTFIFSVIYTFIPISRIKSMNIVDLIKDVK